MSHFIIFYSDYSHSNGNTASHSQLVFQQLNQTAISWRPFSRPILESQRAIAALSDLSPGGILMKDAASSSLNVKDEIPKDILAELKHLTMALDELLYHFWQCVPFSNSAQEKKFMEMRETLERFQYTKLQPFHDKLSREFHRDVSLNACASFYSIVSIICLLPLVNWPLDEQAACRIRKIQFVEHEETVSE